MTEGENFFSTHIQMTEDQFSVWVDASWIMMIHCVSTTSCFLVLSQAGLDLKRKSFLFTMHCQRTSCSEDLGLKTLILMKGNLHLKEWIMKDWHSFLDLEIVCHNARKFDIDVPIHNGHHCIGAPASAPPACTTMFFTHDVTMSSVCKQIIVSRVLLLKEVEHRSSSKNCLSSSSFIRCV